MSKALLVLIAFVGCSNQEEPTTKTNASADVPKSDPGQVALAEFKAWVEKIYTEESRTFVRPGYRSADTTSTFTTSCKMTVDVRATNQVAQPFEGVIKSNAIEAVFQRDGSGWACDKARTADNGCDLLYAVCARDSPMVRDESDSGTQPPKANTAVRVPRPAKVQTRVVPASDPDRFVHRPVGSFDESPPRRRTPDAGDTETQDKGSGGIADPFAE